LNATTAPATQSLFLIRRLRHGRRLHHDTIPTRFNEIPHGFGGGGGRWIVIIFTTLIGKGLILPCFLECLGGTVCFGFTFSLGLGYFFVEMVFFAVVMVSDSVYGASVNVSNRQSIVNSQQ
jgi:hypothetical protein